MAIIKKQEIKKMTANEKEKKIKELKVELAKARASVTKGGNSKVRTIKKTIAQIITFDKSQKEASNNK